MQTSKYSTGSLTIPHATVSAQPRREPTAGKYLMITSVHHLKQKSAGVFLVTGNLQARLPHGGAARGAGLETSLPPVAPRLRLGHIPLPTQHRLPLGTDLGAGLQCKQALASLSLGPLIPTAPPAPAHHPSRVITRWGPHLRSTRLCGFQGTSSSLQGNGQTGWNREPAGIGNWLESGTGTYRAVW